MSQSVSDDDTFPRTRRVTPFKFFLALLLIYSIIGIILLIIFTPSFMVNDDVTMASLVNGDYTGRLSTDLIFIGHLAALPLFLANKILPNIPWYTIFVTWGSFVGLSLIGAIIFARAKNYLSTSLVVYFAASLLILPTVTLEVTFTIAAFLLATAGVLLILVAVDDSSNRKSLFFVSVLAFLFATSIRREAAIAVLILTFPIFITNFLKFNLKKIVLVTCLIFGSLVSNFVLDNFSTNSDWKTFNSFNESRGSIHGNQRFEALAYNTTFGDPISLQSIESIGWTSDEIQNFWTWNFDVPSLFTYQKVEALSSLVGKEPHIGLGDAANEITNNRADQIIFLTLVILISLIFGNKRGRISIFLTAMWASAVFIWTATFQRFPDRIAIPMFLTVASLVCFDLSQHQLKFRRRDKPGHYYVNKVFLVTISILALANLTYTHGTISANAASGRSNFRRNIYNGQIEQLMSIDPTGRFVYVGASIAAEGGSPYSTRTSFAGDLLLGLGWPTFSPIYEDRKKMMGIDTNLVTSLVEQENLYYVTQPVFVEATSRLFSQIYGEPLNFESVGSLSSGAGIYVIRTI